ncbi:aldose epimerase family protein [Peloplasma aerotolerans]|uniref:Aldose 1-epimerase n=1 Tax=Peloplasma aerotolerans TaxID=3044389 RepID=A0AAW6U6P5_9MOLU|nr:aldose epimerase family protein [Mariniplasma sp. M4Ah]MDI6453636.1 aldose epimerase family protein [Mariniplasma sp. M4Ah]
MRMNKEIVKAPYEKVTLTTLENNHGMKVVLSSFGASIYSIEYDGVEMTLNTEKIEDFFVSPAYYGKTVGRISGRLFGPDYEINHQVYQVKLEKDQIAMLHGGSKGFSMQKFEIDDQYIDQNIASITYRYHSPNMEEGFPGNLDLIVEYQLNQLNELKIIIKGNTDQDTLCNITNHIYFNLSKTNQKVHHQILSIDADHYVDVDDQYRFKTKKHVENTIFDFRKARTVGGSIEALKDSALLGIDHTFVLNENPTPAAYLYDPISKYQVTVDTSYPAVVVYTHNLPSTFKLRGLDHPGVHCGITFECQYEADGIHHQELNSAILKKENQYNHYINFKFEKK